MPASDGLAPPVGYSGWWVALGVALLVLVLAWYAWVFWHTRAPRPRPAARDLDDVRRRYLAQIDEVGTLVARGELWARAAHQRLSSIVRAFVSETGQPVSAATLSELTRRGPAPLADLVRGYYPSEFAPGAASDPTAAAAAARQLVSTWR